MLVSQVKGLRIVQTVNIVIVFFLTGLVLKSKGIKTAMRYWLGVVYGAVTILLVTPCQAFAIKLLPLTPKSYAYGAHPPVLHSPFSQLLLRLGV